jgi:hypothetical protein
MVADGDGPRPVAAGFQRPRLCEPGFKTLTWAGFISSADRVTSYYLDNFTLNAQPAGTAPDLGAHQQ